VVRTGTRRSGLITFAGVLALMIGAFNMISGIAAITEDDVTKEAAAVLFDVNVETWGWVWLVLGALQLSTGALIILRHPFGLWGGVTWAVLGATLTAFVIFVYPLWAVLVCAIDVVLLFLLLDHADEFGLDEA
jgi:hypothetical protein